MPARSGMTASVTWYAGTELVRLCKFSPSLDA